MVSQSVRNRSRILIAESTSYIDICVSSSTTLEINDTLFEQNILVGLQVQSSSAGIKRNTKRSARATANDDGR
jgi:hypothetical protein